MTDIRIKIGCESLNAQTMQSILLYLVYSGRKEDFNFCHRVLFSSMFKLRLWISLYEGT